MYDVIDPPKIPNSEKKIEKIILFFNHSWLPYNFTTVTKVSLDANFTEKASSLKRHHAML